MSDGKRKGAALFPRPRTLGSFVLLLSVLAVTAGWLRKELALTLLGAVFLIILAYCFIGIFLLGVTQRRKALSLSLAILTETVSAGKEGELQIRTSGGEPPAKNHFFRLPAILVRCELRLATKDGRVIRHFADPGFENYSKFPVKERGAYFSQSDECDRLIIFDAPGFFILSFAVHQNIQARLLAVPAPAEEPIPVSIRSGGTEERNEPHYRKTDELTDHRPYVPGDDPRRINWKLYSHAHLGELFVREGEPEPPPHSRLLILIDTETDPALYGIDEGRRAVDLLCESALSAALDLSDKGMDILIGWSGETSAPSDSARPLNAAELASALAWPAAVQLPGAELARAELPRAELPPAPGDRNVLIFALPRIWSEPSALDRFLKKREANQGADIIFLYNADSRRIAELEDAARICVNLYNGRSGVYAGKAAVKADREKQ